MSVEYYFSITPHIDARRSRRRIKVGSSASSQLPPIQTRGGGGGGDSASVEC